MVSIVDSGGTNVLQLGAGLTLSNVHFNVSGNDLQIVDGLTGDTIDLVNQFGGAAPAISTVLFADGS